MTLRSNGSFWEVGTLPLDFGSNLFFLIYLNRFSVLRTYLLRRSIRPYAMLENTLYLPQLVVTTMHDLDETSPCSKK